MASRIVTGFASYLLAVDEISIRKGHSYQTGRVVYVGRHRKAKTLNRFFMQLTAKQLKAIEAVVMEKGATHRDLYCISMLCLNDMT
jgi:hypothetical protein